MTKEEFLLAFEKQRHDIELLKIQADTLTEFFIYHLKSGGHVGGLSERNINFVEKTLIATSEYLKERERIK